MKNFVFLMLVLILNTGSIFAQSCEWIFNNSCNEEKNESPAAVINNRLYVFGGFNDSLEASYQTERYNPFNDTWIVLSPMLNNVTHSPAIPVGNKIWIIGGFEGANPGVATDVVQIFNTSNNTWSYGPPLPAARGSLTGARCGSKIHVFGGLMPDRQTDVDEQYFFDINNASAGWQTAAPLPSPRNHHSGVSLGGKLYSVGGQTGHDGPRVYKNIIDVYDPASDSWEPLQGMPVDRSHSEPGTFVMDGKIIVTGGRNGNIFYDDVLAYDPSTNEWSTLCIMDEKLMAPVARAWADNLMVALGGKNSANNAQSDSRVTNVERSYPDDLAFYPPALSIDPEASGILSFSPVLYTLDGSTPYQIESSSLPAWLMVTDLISSTDTDGKSIRIQINPSAIPPALENYQLTATAPGYQDAVLSIEINRACTASSPSAAPQGLTVDYLSPNSVKLDWNAVPGAKRYHVKGRPLGSTGFASIFPLTDFKNVGGLTPGQTYEWQVRVKCADNSITSFSPLATFTMPSSREALSANSESLRIFPNPAQEDVILTISLSKGGKGSLSVYDLSGRILSEERLELNDGQNNVIFETAEYAAGIYLLEVQCGDVRLSERLVIE